MKQAQIFAQPFILIFALIVAILILLFGFKLVIDIQEKAKYAELIDVQAEIKDVARDYYTLGVGSERTLNLKVPKDLKCFCFQNTEDPDSFSINTIPDTCGEDRNDIEQTLLSLSNKQLLVTPGKYPISNFQLINKLYPETNPLCIQIQSSKFKAKITSMGDHVRISAV